MGLTVNDLLGSKRARSLHLDLEDGTHVVLAPPSLNQICACAWLDPKPGTESSPQQENERLLRQAETLLGAKHAYLVGQLTVGQISMLVGLLYAAGFGIDPEDYHRWQMTLRNGKASLDRLAVIEQIEKLTNDIAVEFRVLPDAAGAMPMADAASLLERLSKARKEEAKFQAAIHGMKLS